MRLVTSHAYEFGRLWMCTILIETSYLPSRLIHQVQANRVPSWWVTSRTPLVGFFCSVLDKPFVKETRILAPSTKFPRGMNKVIVKTQTWWKLHDCTGLMSTWPDWFSVKRPIERLRFSRNVVYVFALYTTIVSIHQNIMRPINVHSSSSYFNWHLKGWVSSSL
jgi:hypothetical protein